MPLNGLSIERKLDSLKHLVLLYGNTAEGSAYLMQRYVELLCLSIDSLHELVRDFNELRAMYAGKVELDLTTFDLMEVLVTVTELLRKDAHPEEIIVTLPDNDLPIVAVADRVRFQKAVYYFLSGLLVPSGEGGSALIGADPNNRFMRIIVTIPSQMYEAIRGEDQLIISSEKLLRFHTAKELIKHQGGTLFLSALSRHGCEYIISLPLNPHS